MSKLTMGQIAKDLGLSRTTVSKVVNGRARVDNVSPDIERRVVEYMQKVGYVPNRQALNLRNGTRGAFGILHCGHLVSHVVEAFNLMTDCFVDSPQNVEIVVVKPNDLLDGLRELIARGVQNLIWIHDNEVIHNLPPVESVLSLLSNTTTVVYNFPFDDSDWADMLTARGVHLVGVNRRRGFHALGAMLYELGHRVVALPHNTDDDVRKLVNNHTHLGLTDAGLRMIGCHPPDLPYLSPEQYSDQLAAPIVEAMERFGCTAAVFGDDHVAAHTMRALKRVGVRVPNDLSITSMDGAPWTATLGPTLTTLRIPTAKMVDMVEQILTRGSDVFAHPFAMELTLGESHGPPAGRLSALN